MATHNLIAETPVYEAADRVAASVPSVLALGRFEIELEPPGTLRRRSRSLVATRVEGNWRRGRHGGRVTVDVLAVSPGASLLTVVLHEVPRRHPDGVVRQLARLLQARAEAEPTRPAGPAASSQGTSSIWAVEGTPGVASSG